MSTYTCTFVLLNSDKTWEEVVVKNIDEVTVSLLENGYSGADEWTYEHVSCVHAGVKWFKTILSGVEEEKNYIPNKMTMVPNLNVR